MDIRFGRLGDIEGITKIFNYYIEHTNARFETQPLSVSNRTDWFAHFSPQSRYQIFVMEDEQEILGFACSQPYRPLEAFDDTAEVSVYLSPHAVGKGVGKKLYTALFEALAQSGLHRVLSAIALPNEASVRLHQSFGFRKVGVFDQYAKKNGEYISSLWLEKRLEVKDNN
ncbi:GNAT family N-acetyltransferase [Vibrio sp. SCSIO 43136]|uniref:GNAT family N-acetyltransferase n=1 Tax=Vibrio sp. SCSIO 43136 TaxID=2819101 RepID=UPI0020758E95|nr:GNAT family N-acetyltransferase [Vibrio sp. SCSIO 43136]USD64049.1 N-acetyltransferase [Vibrio sp. SCSIO 43136]